MKITLKILKEKKACVAGVEWFKEKYKEKDSDLKITVSDLMKEDLFIWANWLVTRLVDKSQRVAYAIFAAEQVIGFFEKKYPEDKRPRKAIEAAKDYLKDPSDKNKAAAYAAAYAAADAAKKDVQVNILNYGIKLLENKDA